MTATNKIGIILTFLSLWITSNFSFTFQQITAFVIIFLFGILHGANDIALISKINLADSKYSIKKILIYYISVVLFGILLFYCMPIVALLSFMLFSGYHFGEQHWGFLNLKKQNIIVFAFQTIYGLFVFSLLFYFHQIEVKKIITLIVKENIDFLNFGYTTLILGFLLLVLGAYFYKISIHFKASLINNIFYLLVFAILFKTADLIWAFAIYFVVWHSIPSMKEQISFLYGNFTPKNFLVYFKSAFPYWIISLIGIAILYFLFKDKEIFNALFFSFLAAITFPHTIIILKMQDKNKKTASY